MYPLGAEKFEIPIHVVVSYEKGRKEKHGRSYRMLTSNNIDWPAKKIAAQYKKRFGIESSYRQLNVLKAMTTSRDQGLRYLYVLLAFMLCNMWIAIRFLHFGECHVGPKTFHPSNYILKDFIEELRQELRRHFKCGRMRRSGQGRGTDRGIS